MLDNEQLQDLRFMMENGFTRAEAAEVLGKSVGEIAIYLKTHEIRSILRTKEKNGLYFCNKCRNFKPKEDFHKEKRTRFGISTYCKECNKNRMIELKKKKCFAEIDAIIAKNKEFEKTKAEATGETKRRCSTCGITKEINDFHWYEKNKSVKKQCKNCHAAYRKKWELKKLEERGY